MVIVFDSAGQVTVSVEGRVFAPMSEAEARDFIRASINQEKTNAKNQDKNQDKG